MNHFIIEESNVYSHVTEFKKLKYSFCADYYMGKYRFLFNGPKNSLLGDLLVDLFGGNGFNSALLELPNTGKLDNVEIVENVFPDRYHKSEKRSYKSNVLFCRQKDNKIGKSVIRDFKENGEKIIEDFVDKLSPFEIVDIDALKKYLTFICRCVIFNSTEEDFLKIERLLKVPSDKSRDEFEQMINNDDLKVVCAKIIIAFQIACEGVKHNVAEGKGNAEIKQRQCYAPVNDISLTDLSNIQYAYREKTEALFAMASTYFEQKNYSKVEEIIKELESIPDFEKMSEYNLLKGKLLFIEKNKETAEDALYYLEESNTGEGYFLLSECYDILKNDYERDWAFDEAVKNRYPKAVIKKIKADLQKRSENFAGKRNIKALNDVLNEKNYSLSRIDKSNCLYYLGLFDKLNGDENSSQKYFSQAAELGHELARAQIENIKRIEIMESVFVPSNDDVANMCYMIDTISSSSKMFINSIPEGKWNLLTPNDMAIKDFINGINIKIKNMLVFFDDNVDKNLEECLFALDVLFNKALDYNDKKARGSFLESVDLYIKTDDYQYASMLIDASLSSMNDGIYFKVHIVDEAKMNARRLLTERPLFTPLMDNSALEDINVALIGGENYSALKEIVAINQIDIENKHKINVNLISNDADRLAIKFKNECPGVYNNKGYYCIKPKFEKCDIDAFEFFSLFEACQPNYIVVDTGDYKLNLKIATCFRTYLLKKNLAQDYTPLICIHIEGESNTYLAKRLTIDNKVQGQRYFNNFNFYFFGYDLCKFDSLVDNKLERQAYAVHKSYYKKTGENEINENEVRNDFWSYSYNRDSSIATAVGLPYRLYAVGLYGLGIDEIKSRFNAMINNNVKKSSLAMLEQSRWNGYMIANGWESASIEDVEKYHSVITNDNHKHVLAKMHPFIAPWSEIISEKGKTKFDMLKKEFSSTKSPYETTMDSISDTIKFIEV